MRKSFFLVPLLALAMSSCSSDEPAVGGGETPDAQDGFYATVSFKLPTAGSRATGPNGEEVGQTYENKISSILIILAEPHEATEYSEANYTYVSYAYTDAPTYEGEKDENPTKKYTINFQDKESLFKYADGGDKKVNVFAYCNPPQTFVDYVLGLAAAPADTDKVFTDEIMSADIVTIWNDKKVFLMTSSKMHDVVLPSQDVLKSKHNSPKSAFNLTETEPIEVMRTAVRFDYKDGATAVDDKNEVIPLTYRIKDISDETKYQGTVTLTRAALFNLRNQFYYLPRTAAVADGALTLCPEDIEIGHVVSPDKATGRTYSEAITDDQFNAPLDPTAISDLEWYNLASVLGANEDSDDGWEHPDAKPDDEEGAKKLKEDYYIWRYATENTFAYNATAFPREETTGVVFEAEIKIDGVTEGTENMYLYNGTIYTNVEQLAKAAETYPGSILAADFGKVFEQDATTKEWSLKKDYENALEAEGFTIYRPKAGKYYCYYYYFNKHNDNEKPEVIAPFEFATVRNNVYKLSVTNIKKFATFLPPTTVEDWDVYFSLDVKVRPWTVRVNDIEF